MAIAMIRARPLSRGKGQSAVACAAYRACVLLHDNYYGKEHDYSKKSGHVDGGVVLPKGVTITREELWNLVEEAEKRSDARFGKEVLVALPKEFNEEENRIVALRIAICLSEEHKADGSIYYYPLQWDIHGPHIEAIIDDNGNFVLDEEGKKMWQSNDNKHVHNMISERPWDFEAGTFSSKKDRYRNTDEWLAAKKIEIGEIINSMLREKGLPEVDFRSWEERNAESIAKTGKELEKPQRHQGPARTNIERKRRRRLARSKMEKDNELKKAKGELKKLEAKSKSTSSGKSKNQVPSLGNFADEISSKVAANIAKKQEVTIVVSKGASRASKQSISAPEAKPKENKPQQLSHDIPLPMPKPAGQQHGHAHSGPDHKCFLCIPDGSDRCKYCKFREDELGEEHSGGYVR